MLRVWGFEFEIHLRESCTAPARKARGPQLCLCNASLASRNSSTQSNTIVVELGELSSTHAELIKAFCGAVDGQGNLNDPGAQFPRSAVLSVSEGNVGQAKSLEMTLSVHIIWTTGWQNLLTKQFVV